MTEVWNYNSLARHPVPAGGRATLRCTGAGLVVRTVSMSHQSSATESAVSRPVRRSGGVKSHRAPRRLNAIGTPPLWSGPNTGSTFRGNEWHRTDWSQLATAATKQIWFYVIFIFNRSKLEILLKADYQIFVCLAAAARRKSWLAACPPATRSYISVRHSKIPSCQSSLKRSHRVCSALQFLCRADVITGCSSIWYCFQTWPHPAWYNEQSG